MSGTHWISYFYSQNWQDSLVQSKLTGFTSTVKLSENASSQNWQKSLVQSKLMEITNSQNWQNSLLQSKLTEITNTDKVDWNH